MTWIQTVGEDGAGGLLGKLYADAVERAGRVFQILKLTSLNPPVLHAWIQLYMAVMHGPSPLGRARREMLAVWVSRLNHCYY